MSGGPGNVPKRVCTGLVFQLVILIIGIVLAIQMSRVGVVSDQNTNTVTEIVDDWNELPFVKVLSTDDKCPSGTESIFVREWGGSEPGCLVNKADTWGFGSTQTVMTQSEYNSYVS